ncbi:hypothetical protein [Paenibacillus pini]|uniref:Uncharacterized protein n=1 Tax=Paenibacillus pini JCM 16418 TaxID=1236976 RepID=W7YNX3_9BACL|nr:hypothetical protein [Paenibacillus pini]GAF10127.1 hypothetical protein JCM16418_4302 [Paenibacillus pini JCM 16418]
MMAAPIGLFALTSSFWFFQNSIQLFNFNRQWTLIAIVFMMIIPLLLFAIHRPSKSAKPAKPT